MDNTTLSSAIYIPILLLLSTVLIAYLAKRLGVDMKRLNQSNNELHNKLDRLISSSSIRGSISEKNNDPDNRV